MPKIVIFLLFYGNCINGKFLFIIIMHIPDIIKFHLSTLDVQKNEMKKYEMDQEL